MKSRQQCVLVCAVQYPLFRTCIGQIACVFTLVDFKLLLFFNSFGKINCCTFNWALGCITQFVKSKLCKNKPNWCRKDFKPAEGRRAKQTRPTDRGNASGPGCAKLLQKGSEGMQSRSRSTSWDFFFWDAKMSFPHDRLCCVPCCCALDYVASYRTSRLQAVYRNFQDWDVNRLWS